MKKIISILSVFILLCFVVGFKRGHQKETIVIYTSTEDYNMNYLQECLDKEFPDYNIVIEYMSTSNIASKVIEEGSSSEADIIYSLEYGYIEKMVEANVIANFGDRYDDILLEDDAMTDTLKGYAMPSMKMGCGVIVNKNVLKQKGLDPKCYDDLLKPEYKGFLSMPSPKSSATGYLFYKSFVDARGESEALKYFDGFYKNICNNFTQSGSGPVNYLISGEAAVGFGMLSQAVDKISDGYNELEILFFEPEGAPFSILGQGVVKGKEKEKSVMEVMDYITRVYTPKTCEKYYPENIYKDVTYEVSNFPKNIPYAKMENNTQSEKERLLKLWRY